MTKKNQPVSSARIAIARQLILHLKEFELFEKRLNEAGLELTQMPSTDRYLMFGLYDTVMDALGVPAQGTPIPEGYGDQEDEEDRVFHRDCCRDVLSDDAHTSDPPDKAIRKILKWVAEYRAAGLPDPLAEEGGDA